MTAKKPAVRQENLIRNGDFSQGQIFWMLAGSVHIQDASCKAEFGGSASQEVTISAGGQFHLSFSTRTSEFANGAGGGVLTLTMSPSNQVEHFSFELDQFGGWVTKEYAFTASSSDTKVTVKALAPTYGTLFDDFVLVHEGGQEPDELIKNGDFEQGGEHWPITAKPPAGMRFDGGHCVGTLRAYAEQTVAISPGSPYRFSLATQIKHGGAGFALLEMLPSLKLEIVSFHDNHDWTVRGLNFTAPPGTHSVRVVLIAGDGEVYFDNASLKLLRA